MRYLRWLMLGLVATLAGCGGVDSESVTPPDVSPKEEIQTILEPAAAGEPFGSEIGMLMEKITALKETDADLAASLEQDANKLMEQMSSKPAEVKVTAQAMLDKLK